MKTSVEKNKQTLLEVKKACQSVEKSMQRVEDKRRQQIYKNRKKTDQQNEDKDKQCRGPIQVANRLSREREEGKWRVEVQ